jgi:hypothetical protein
MIRLNRYLSFPLTKDQKNIKHKNVLTCSKNGLYYFLLRIEHGDTPG